MGGSRWIAAALGLLLWLGCPPVAQADGATLGDRCLLDIQNEGYATAIASCTQALQLEPDAADYYLSRGLALYRSGQYAAALKDDTQVLATHPEDYRAIVV